MCACACMCLREREREICIMLNKECSFTILLQSICHGKSDQKFCKKKLPQQCHVKEQYTEYWKKIKMTGSVLDNIKYVNITFDWKDVVKLEPYNNCFLKIGKQQAWYCRWFWESVANGFIDLEIMFFCDGYGLHPAGMWTARITDIDVPKVSCHLSLKDRVYVNSPYSCKNWHNIRREVAVVSRQELHCVLRNFLKALGSLRSWRLALERLGRWTADLGFSVVKPSWQLPCSGTQRYTVFFENYNCLVQFVCNEVSA